jgi:hypothetical protein
MKNGQIRVPYNFLEISPKINAKQTDEEEEETLLKEPTTSKMVVGQKEISHTKSYTNLRKLTKGTIAIHMLSCLVILVGTVAKLGGNDNSPRFGDGRVWRVASCWGSRPDANASVMTIPKVEDIYITNRMSTSIGFERIPMIAFLLIIFFLLSAVFQYMSLRNENHQDSVMTNKANWLRYAEYSLSASCMIVAIFISFGMLESYLHISVFTLTFLCMIIGLAVDYMRNLSDTTGDDTEPIVPESHLIKLRMVVLRLHYVGWVPMLVVWGILGFVVFDMANGTFSEVCGRMQEGNTLPSFVWIVVIGEFTLFNAFGYVQWTQIGHQFDIRMYKIDRLRIVRNTSFLHTNKNYNAGTVGLATERKFVILSLLAKSLLGWTIFSQVIVA